MYYIGSIACNPNYLAHHGIKGQKWGVRRYQDEDGTWTEAGKRRYGKDEKTFRSYQEMNVKKSEASERAHLEKAKKAKNSVDAEAHRKKAETARANAERAKKRLSTFDEMSTEDRAKVLGDSAKREHDSRKAYNKKTWGAAFLSGVLAPAGTVKMANALRERSNDIFNPNKNFGSQEMDAYIADIERTRK